MPYLLLAQVVEGPMPQEALSGCETLSCCRPQPDECFHRDFAGIGLSIPAKQESALRD